MVWLRETSSLLNKTGKPLVELRCVSKEYPMDGTVVKALSKVSFKVYSRELTTIVGASGSGKSTLLHLLGLLDRPTRGEILFSGRKMTSLTDEQLARLRNRSIGFVFQQFNLLARTSALDNVLLPAWYNSGLEVSQTRERAKSLFAQFGLEKRLEHFPNQLSGGEQQRVAIIRALICDPEMILADEPTGNLDSKTGREIMDLLVNLNRKEKKTVVIVTHERRLAQLGRRKIYLADGKVSKKR